MAPEQAAQFLRDTGHDVTILEKSEGSPRGGDHRYVREPMVDGKSLSIAKMYELVNDYRQKAGLAPVTGPK